MGKKQNYFICLLYKRIYMSKYTFIIGFALLSWINGFSQIDGDYQSASSGDWITLSTWQRFNGTVWVTPTPAQGYPGQYAGTGALTIQPGHTVTISDAGITTQPMGTITIQNTGQLYLKGATNTMLTFFLNTTILDIIEGGSIYFYKKVKLQFITDAVITLGENTGSLIGDCNNNNEIWIGSIKYMVCAGSPGNIFTFSEVMSMGGTLNSIPSSNSPICQTNTINLTGNYSGAIGDAPTYFWTITAPGGGVTTFDTQNPSIPNAVTGTYLAKLTISTNLSGTIYTNSDSINVIVNPLPTLSGASQTITVCDGSGATINLSGLVPNTTFSLNYSINGDAQPVITGLVADETGASSFTTVNLDASNNGQTLQITGITITNPTTNCAQTFTKDVTMSVFTTGAGTWKGTTSSDWNEASNWCGGVPSASTDVYISQNSASILNQPIIDAAGGICKNITINNGATLTINGTNTLNVNGNWTNNGTYTPNSSTVSFTSTVASQTIGGTGANTFNNLTINNTGGGVEANDDITVNGVLNLASANPSATVGALEMGSNVLTMGASATNTGQGDVNGTITRTSISANIEYTFGNPYTVMTFLTPTGSGALPSTVSLKTTIGTAPSLKTDAILRSYDISQTGAVSPALALIEGHYLDDELNGNTEADMVYWSWKEGQSGYTEFGRAGINTTENYVDYINLDISVMPDEHGERIITCAKGVDTANTWIGTSSSNWNIANNWTAGHVPSDTDRVVIPDASSTNYDPELPASPIGTVKKLRLAPGSILNGGTGGILTVSGGDGAWLNQGTFNPGTSTVTFTDALATYAGNTDFYNLILDPGCILNMVHGSYIGITGTMTNNGTWRTVINGHTTVEYKGDDQTVVVPNPSTNRYSTLILSGTGIKTMPSTALHIVGDFTMAGSASTTAAAGLTIDWDFTLGSGTKFNAGNFSHNIAGDFINNGGTFTNTGSTINLNGVTEQTIGGSASTTFNNLTLNNSAGATLGINESVAGTLTLTNGLLTTGSHTITLTACSGTTITGYSSSSYVNGILAQVYCSTGSKVFPIGKGGNYRPLTLEYTALTETSTVTAEQFETTIGGTLPANHTVLQDRHWDITQTGGTDIEYTLTLDGTSYDPGVAVPKIIKGDGSSNTSYTATYDSPNFTATGLTGFSSFSVGADCVPPTIESQPASTATCDGTGAPTFSITASGGTLSYQWQESTTGTGGTFENISDGGVYSNTTTSTLTITNPPLSMDGYAYRVVVTRLCGSDVVSNGNAVLTVNPVPAITLGASPAVCSGVLTAELTYNGTTGNPNQYSINYSEIANTSGFTDFSFTGLPESPISLTVPGGASPSTYSGLLYVKNSATGCESTGSDFTVMVRPLPQGSLTGNTICSGGTGKLTWVVTAGTGPYTVVYNDGSDHTANNVASGVPFDVYSSQTETKVYNLISVSSTNSCERTSGFTVGTGTVTVSTGIWTGQTTDWNDAGNWCEGIPTSTTDVLIPSSAPNQPVIGDADGICNSITIESGAFLTISGSNTLTVYGNWINDGTFYPNSSTVIFNGTTAISGSSSNSFNNITIESEKTLTAQAESMLVSGNFINNGTFNSNNGTIVFSGSAAQTITGDLSFYDIIFFNVTNGLSDVNITTPVTVSNSASFLAGIVNFSGTGSLKFMNGSSCNDGTASSFVNGPVVKEGNTAFTFPVGKGDWYAPISISAASGGGIATDFFTAEYHHIDPNTSYDSSLHDASINHISSMEYWTLERTGTTNNVYVTLSWDSLRSGTVTNLTSITTAHWNGEKWIDIGNAETTGSTTSGTVSSAELLTSFSPFTLASKDNNNPLPVELISFYARYINEKVQLNWVTVSETNNDYYTIERSKDAINFQNIGIIDGAGNSNMPLFYSYIDNEFFRNISYYRLKQTDFDGSSKYSNIIYIDLNNQMIRDNKVYPNPFSDELIIELEGSDELMNYEIINAFGQVVFKGNLVEKTTVQTSHFTPGVYLIKLKNGKTFEFKKIIKE